MPIARLRDVSICYETLGDAADPPLLLVAGLGAQMLSWPDEFCQSLVDRCFHVIRFDNRDSGESTWFDGIDFDPLAVVVERDAGLDVAVPYTLNDMAVDAIGLLDHLEIASAHVAGMSLGGMIAQTIAIDHPERVRSLTSIMSTTGEPHVGQPSEAALAAITAPSNGARDDVIEADLAKRHLWGSPGHIDDDAVRLEFARSFDRAHNPPGTARQFGAILFSENRVDAMRRIDVPTAVIHGALDPLVHPSGGRRTARVIPGAELVEIEGMAHDLPPFFWPQVIDALVRVAQKAPSPSVGG